MPSDAPRFSSHLESAMTTQRPLITLLTDFGQRDGFIGVMKGVMLGISPNAHLIDITHDLPPFTLEGASFLNEWSFGYFPVGSVHLCVVDPGVGTSRRGLAVQSQGHFFVAPDNGVLSPILQNDPHSIVVSLTNSEYWLGKVSTTFHGRDIFSPVAAHLSTGTPIHECGESISDPVLIPVRKPRFSDTRIQGEIRYIDRFGNLISTIERPAFDEWAAKRNVTQTDVRIALPATTVEGISTTYGEQPTGELVAVFNGYDALEVAVTQGNAAQRTGLSIGDPIEVIANG